MAEKWHRWKVLLAGEKTLSSEPFSKHDAAMLPCDSGSELVEEAADVSLHNVRDGKKGQDEDLNRPLPITDLNAVSFLCFPTFN